MNGSIIVNKARICSLVFLSLLISSSINGTVSPTDINDISAEERSALKDKTIWGILSECSQKSLPLERAAKLIVVKMKDETLVESLNNLHELDSNIFAIPPEISGKLRIETRRPLPKNSDSDVIDLCQVLDNRRFAKLIQELPALSKVEVAALVTKEIELSLSEYDKMYSFYFEKALKYYDSIKSDPIGKGILPGLPSNNPDRTPTLKGLRHKILALMLIAGNLELKESQTAVHKVLYYAIDQRDKLYNKEIFEEKFSSLMLQLVSLYNRQILGTAILGACLSLDESKQVLANVNAGFKERKLKPYNHLPSAENILVLGMRSLVLLDDKDGKVSIRHIEPLDDSQFDKLIDATMKAPLR